MEGELTLSPRREALAAARTALTGLRHQLWQAGGGELGPLLRELDDLAAACAAAQVAVIGEAGERGETTGGSAAFSVTQWIHHWAPSTRAGGAGTLADLAGAFAKPVNAPVQEALETGRIPVRSAAVVVSEADKLRPRLADGAEPHVLEGLIAMAEEHGPRGCRMVRPALLARYGLSEELQTEQDAARRFIGLSQPHDDGTGVFEYRLSLDVEGKTVLEAALGPLSAPQPSRLDGPDPRSSDRRRGEALVTLVRRAVASGESIPTTAKAQLVLTLDYEALRDRVGAASTIGGLDAGTLLAPETVRRIACDASVIPVVLGTDGEVLDWGHARRLFTPAQIKRLWLRDGGCTYPDCDAPPQWADAHHLVHWADGGPTDLGNAALLCQRHHTIVHSRRLAGRVVAGRVEWDRAGGSYDDALRQPGAAGGDLAPPRRA